LIYRATNSWRAMQPMLG